MYFTDHYLHIEPLLVQVVPAFDDLCQVVFEVTQHHLSANLSYICANSGAQTDLDTDGFVKILTEGTDGILGKLSVIHHHLVYYVDASCIFISGADASEMVTECTCH